MYEDPTGRRNSSGCPDPTAYRAVARTQDQEAALDRLKGLRRVINAMAAHDGAWVEVTLTDKRTGARLG